MNDIKKVGQLPITIHATLPDGETVKLGRAFVDLVTTNSDRRADGSTFRICADFDQVRETIETIFAAQQGQS